MVAVHTPTSRVTVSSGTGALPASVEGETLLIGSSTTGTAGTLYSFSGGDTSAITAALGKGDVVRAACRHLVDSGGRPTHVLKVAATTAGSSSAVVQIGGGPAVTVAAPTPIASADVVIRIVTPGAVATATFVISYDGGDTFSDVIATAATFITETAETVTFPVGAYVAGATYAYTNTGPSLTSGDIATALDNYIARPNLDPEFVHIVGFPALATDAATISTGLIGKITTAENVNKYPIVCQELPPVDPATIVTAFANISCDWLQAYGGFCELADVVTNRVEKRNVAYSIVPRMARNAASISAMRNANDSDLERLPGIMKLVPEGAVASSGYYDAASTPGLPAARIATAMHINGKEGFFANALTLAANSSDFGLVPLQRVMRKAQRATYQWSLTKLDKRLDTLPNGQVAGPQKRSLEGELNAYLENFLGGDLPPSAKVVTEVLPTNVAQTSRLELAINITKLGYARDIRAVMAFAVNIAQAA